MPEGDCLSRTGAAALPLEAARRRLLAEAQVLTETETLDLRSARGRVLARAPVAAVDLPPCDTSAMDGYAVHADDLVGHRWIAIAGWRAEGQAANGSIRPGETQAIAAGCPVPVGTAAIVRSSGVRSEAGRIWLDTEIAPGTNIRRRAEDQARGAALLSAGQHLTGPALAMLAECGTGDVEVIRRVRITLIGHVAHHAAPHHAAPLEHMVEASRVLLRSWLDHPWIDLRDAGMLPTDPMAIRQALLALSASADVILVAGGGTENMLDAMSHDAERVDLLHLATRPGKPLGIGRLRGALWVGLPCTPYAAAVLFLTVVWPAIRRCGGLGPDLGSCVQGVADFDYANCPGRLELLPVTWTDHDAGGRPRLVRLGRGASARLEPLALARGLAMVPGDVDRVRTGTPLVVTCLPG